MLIGSKTQPCRLGKLLGRWPVKSSKAQHQNLRSLCCIAFQLPALTAIQASGQDGISNLWEGEAGEAPAEPAEQLVPQAQQKFRPALP